MSKKIKLLFTICLLAICLGIGTLTEAYSPAELFPHRQTIINTTTEYLYFCKEKGGALRVFAYTIDANSSETKFLGTSTGKYSLTSIKSMLNTVITNTKEDLVTAISNLGAKERAYKVTDEDNPVSNFNGIGGDEKFEFEDDVQNDVQVSVEYDLDTLPIGVETTVSVVKGKKIASKPVYRVDREIEVENNKTAYILTAGAIWTPQDYDTTNYNTYNVSDTATDDQIQYALWQNKPEYNEGRELRDNELGNDGGLYAEAQDYEDFYNTYLKQNQNGQNNYNPTISLVNNYPKIIVNKGTGKYTIGPYIVTYPDDARFSFVEDMYVKDQTGNRIDVTVISEDGNKYPSTGKQFFVEFEYATDPTEITVHATFAHIQDVYAKYTRMVGEGKIYQYVGKVKVKVEEVEGSTSEAKYRAKYTKSVKLENVKNGDNDKTYPAQVAARIDTIIYKDETQYADASENSNRKRTWATVDVSCSQPVKISMEIGGTVFVDATLSKESNPDGKYDSNTDIPMSGVLVTLHKKDSDEKKYTTTGADGKYVFTGLNVLGKYYVEFTYNGQYYEPTYYTKPSNSEGYEYTSNGTDYAEIRCNLNLRFASIGSNTANYNGTIGYDENYRRTDITHTDYNETYTKNQLIEAGIIDEFGNLIDSTYSENDTEKKKMIQYVYDCTISSYTKNNGTNKKVDSDDKLNYYPSTSFIINQKYTTLGGQTTLDYSQVKINDIDTTKYDKISVTISGSKDYKSRYINQGYKARQEADVALIQDVYSARIEINGKSEEYLYNQREIESLDTQGNGWEIGNRIAEGYYGTLYSREIFPSDYQFKVTDYGTEFRDKYNKTLEDELNVYVTYVIRVLNRSQSIRTKIDEVVHYYDSEYEYIDDIDKSYIKFPDVASKQPVYANDTSRYAHILGTTTNLSRKGYNTIYITGLDDRYLSAGQSAYIYLTFRVKKTEMNNQKWIILDENAETAVATDLGKDSISEINGYSTLYKEGTEIPNIGNTGENTVAGLVDVDSNPGNLNPDDIPNKGDKENDNFKQPNYENFEDDTDKAPSLRVVLYRASEENKNNNARIISGYIWEDKRNQVIAGQATATGNGIRENGEKLIDGVTVQLVEIMQNGQEYIWAEYENGSGTATTTAPIIESYGITDYEFEGDATGRYAFKSFVPGNYIVRFKYGDTEKTVLTESSEVTNTLGKSGLNDTSYNGQDYKSTIYQAGLEDTYNGENISKQYNYDIAKGDTALVSDAKDLWNVRSALIDKSKGEMRNELAEILDSYENVPKYNNTSYTRDEMNELLNQFMAKHTSMTAETGIINMQVEYNTDATNVYNENGEIIKRSYHLQNLDLGLEERPKAQIEIIKDIKNIKITLANGNVLFDANGTADNLLWQPSNDTIIDGYYENNLMKIRTPRVFRLVQPTMDQELMHGATVRITYQITAKNIGETDYKEEQFYYTGIVADKNKVVKTNALQVVDYIPNNIQYYEVDNNNYWSVIKPEELVEQKLVNRKLLENLKEFNTIVTSTKTNKALVPAIYKSEVGTGSDSISIPLVLTQLITAENDTADLTYNNKVELVAQNNTVGRKMAYSVPGNQDPIGEIAEIDSDKATVTILPPFGATLTYIIIAIITIAGAAVIAVGIIFIKKKVLKK